MKVNTSAEVLISRSKFCQLNELISKEIFSGMINNIIIFVLLTIT